MKILYSDILPLTLEDGKQTITDCFNELAASSDSLKIAVGYISNASLLELDSLVEKHNISHITLTIGMYYIEGMPEKSYHTAVNINEKWKKAGIGEIRIVRALRGDERRKGALPRVPIQHQTPRRAFHA